LLRARAGALVAVVVDGVVQLRAAVAGAPELLDVGAAGRGVALQLDRARVGGLHEVVHQSRHPLAQARICSWPASSAGMLGIRHTPSGVNSDAPRS
jgi:hypothetical protein